MAVTMVTRATPLNKRPRPLRESSAPRAGRQTRVALDSVAIAERQCRGSFAIGAAIQRSLERGFAHNVVIRSSPRAARVRQSQPIAASVAPVLAIALAERDCGAPLSSSVGQFPVDYCAILQPGRAVAHRSSPAAVQNITHAAALSDSSPGASAFPVQLVGCGCLLPA